jgi:hypothetical protein
VTNPANWDELSAAEIVAALGSPGNPQPISTPFLDCHQWIPLVEQFGWQAAGGFPDSQWRCVYQAATAPSMRFWQLSGFTLGGTSQSGRGARRALGQRLPAGSFGDLLYGTRFLTLAALPQADACLIELGAQLLAEAPLIDYAVKRTTVPSPRLDAVAAAIFHVSREEAQTALEYGFVFMNFKEASKRSVLARATDIVVYRSKGRAVIAGCELNPRSKRYWLDYSVFPL